MRSIFFCILVIFGMNAQAQVTKVSLQASGLTCSMCSKAVKMALEEVAFVEKVQVNIKTQEYNLSFKQGMTVDFDALNKAVQDAGFSVAALQVTALVQQKKLQKDEHHKIGEQYFHFLNASNQLLDGLVSLSLVDKGFVSPKEFKKYAALTKMACVQTGRMEKCCSADVSKDARLYHVFI